METLEIAPGSFVDLYRNWAGSPEALFRMVHEEVQWESKTIVLYGKEIMQPRLVAWYGSAAYTYSGRRNDPLVPTPTLSMLMSRVTREIGLNVNSVLCNLYRNGNDSIGMHSDDEPELGKNPVIVSLSLGATRKFTLAPNGDGMKFSLDLHGGDLLVMRGRTQETHKHGLPKRPKVIYPRINLTFRYLKP